MAGASHGPVLIVDDDVDMREALRLLIETRGHTVATAGNGAEALDALRGGMRPCLILLDLMMPVKDGFAFRAEQCRDETIAGIPVVVLSAHHDSKHDGSLVGVVAHFQKPLTDLQALLRIVQQHCKPPPTC
jgi:CheY-like chemotaxis protein